MSPLEFEITRVMNIERLKNKLKKRVARTVLKADFMTPSADMFKELDWLPVTKRIDYYNKAVLTYKALNKQSPSYVSDLITPVSQVCNRSLRSSDDSSLFVPRSRTTLYDGSSHAPRQDHGIPYLLRCRMPPPPPYTLLNDVLVNI